MSALPTLGMKFKQYTAEKLFEVKLFFNGESNRSRSNFKKKYVVSKLIGQGGFGVVYRGYRRCDHLPVAVKFVNRKNIREWAKVGGEVMPMEIFMLCKLANTQGVIRLLDWYATPAGYVIVMERPFPCTDMFELLRVHGKVDEEVTRFLFRQILTTVLDLQDKAILHRDLKDENVLINLDTGELKLIDFGAATVLNKTKYTEFQGTRLYCPPEWFLHSVYLGKEAAVWSLGVLLYNTLHASLPFKNEKDICTFHNLGDIPHYSPVTPEFRDLVSRCLAFEPSSRIKLDEIANHPWLKVSTPTWVDVKKSLTKLHLIYNETILNEQLSLEADAEDDGPITIVCGGLGKQPTKDEADSGISSLKDPTSSSHKKHQAKTTALATPVQRLPNPLRPREQTAERKKEVHSDLDDEAARLACLATVATYKRAHQRVYGSQSHR